MHRLEGFCDLCIQGVSYKSIVNLWNLTSLRVAEILSSSRYNLEILMHLLWKINKEILITLLAIKKLA